MPDVNQLRHELFLEDVASRLAAGETPRKIARELNQRPDALKQLIRSDDFLDVLSRLDKDLADDIIEEREAAKPAEYEELILKEAAEAVKTLASIRDNGESENAQVAASRTIIDIAEKTKKVRGEKLNRRMSFPAKQLNSLNEAARELNEMTKRVADANQGASGEPVSESP